MTLQIELPSELEDRLRGEARRRGIDTSEYARQLIEDHLPAAETNTALGDLFAQWAREDATDDPAEIARRQEEFEEFKKSMNENHTSNRRVYQ